MPHIESGAFQLASGGRDAIRTAISIADPLIGTPPIVGPVATTTIPFGIPTDINSIIRTAIDVWFGGRGGGTAGVTPLQEPISGGLMIPVPGTPGGALANAPGVCCPPGFGGRRSMGGRVPFITLPNGCQGCPQGYHPEKQGRPYCVRNRRMNPLNPRALSRATRRVGGFARAVKRARTLKTIVKNL